MYSVRSLKVGGIEVPGPQVFWMSSWDDWIPLLFQVVLIEGDGVRALVNTGLPTDIAALRDAWATAGERAVLRRDPEWEIGSALAGAGVEPDDITHVILTPLQLYTTSNIALFANASICLSQRGWVHFHTTHEHPHDDRWTSITRDVLVHLVTDAWDRVRLLSDEDEIAPGLRTWWSGVHHRASIVVEVDTPNGVVAISDSFFHYENVEGGRILGINESMDEALRTNDRVLQVADHIVPLYDPKVFERYPGGIVSQL